MKNKAIILIFICHLLYLPLQAQYEEFKVNVTGKGEPVLLIPGFTCTAAVWDETVNRLSQNYECHAFTLAGFGGVPPVSFPWLPKIKDAMLKYVKDKKLYNSVVIGHSLGGTLALWLSIEEDTLFKKLILIDALPSVGALMIPDFKPETLAYDNSYNKKLLEMEEKDFSAMAGKMASFMALNSNVHSNLISWILESDRETYVKGYTDLLKLDLRNEISQIQIPVTILAATYPNKEFMQVQYQKQFAKLKHKRVIYIADSAHFIMYDQPDRFISTLISELTML